VVLGYDVLPMKAAEGSDLEFPPRLEPGRELQMRQLLMTLASVVAPQSARYVAGPITTGERFVTWFLEAGQNLGVGTSEYRRRHHDDVVRPNLEVIRARARACRAQNPSMAVVEPATLEISEWDQNDYRYFWGKVVEDFAAEVVALRGWHLSSGASYEILVATRMGLEVRDEDGKLLAPPEVGGLVSDGADRLRRLGLPSPFLERISQELSCVVRSKVSKTQDVKTRKGP
jgi:hypothetical protein